MRTRPVSIEIVYEWLAPISSPNTFDDHMKVYGVGVHHLAMNVPDMPETVAKWKAAGFKVASAGAWGEKPKPGSGRFSYVARRPSAA